MKKAVIIVAGGKGKRMGSTLPKQFLKLGKKPIIHWAIEQFYNYDNQINVIVVLPENQFSFWAELNKNHQFSIPHKLVKGGEERFHSVLNGLSVLKDEELVAIHDAVRPMVSEGTIKRTFDSAEKNGSGIPVTEVVNSLRKINGNNSASVPRSEYRIVQTPQTFKTEQILKAFKTEYQEIFTDDATVYEKMIGPVSLVEGNSENIKVTTPIDIIISESILKLKQ